MRIITAVSLIFVTFFVVNCEKEIIISESRWTNFIIVDSMSVPVSSFINKVPPFDTAIDDSNNFYFIDFYGRNIVRFSNSLMKFDLLGSTGQGPGEYSTPFKLDISQNHLFYSDLNNSLIKSINIREVNSSNIENIGLSSGGSSVKANNKTLVVYNGSMLPRLRAYSIENDTPLLVGEGMPIDEMYKIPAKKIKGGGIDIDRDDRIYAVHVAPFKIHIFNSQVQLQTVLDIKNPPGYVAFSKSLYKKIRSKKQKKVHEAITSFSLLTKLWLIERHDGGQDIIVQSTNPDDSNLMNYYLIATTGELIETIVTNRIIIAVKMGNIYTWEKDKNNKNVEIKKYKYNR